MPVDHRVSGFWFSPGCSNTTTKVMINAKIPANNNTLPCLPPYCHRRTFQHSRNFRNVDFIRYPVDI